MFSFNREPYNGKKINPFYKKSGIYIISMVSLFVFIGLLTTIKPAYRFSSEAITSWTSDIDSATFLYLMGMENRSFRDAYPKDKQLPKLSSTFFHIFTNVKPDDPVTLLGREIPGFSSFENRIVIAGEGTDYSTLSIESSPPLEDVLEDRQATLEDTEEEEIAEDHSDLSTGDKDVVFIYNTHNRESFLPHLPDVTDPNKAHHGEVNITKVSDRLAKVLEANGIGVQVDTTDHMNVLNEKGWGYGRSYEASREMVQETMTNNNDIQYIFDLHRDSVGRDTSTIDIDGKSYAKILMVVGKEYDSYEKNLSLATEFHYLINEMYPGLSRGVITKEGAGTNGVFNQDLSDRAMLLELGGYDNTLEELYRTIDIVGDIFSDYYWDAEKVSGDS